MKHLDANGARLLDALLTEADITVPQNAKALMLRHIEWLLEANQELNLTAVLDPGDAIRLHVVDSLIALPEVREAPDGLMLDVGTGGGFPGVELALASGREALLVDSVQKKARALSAFLVHESLDTRISVSGERTEAIASERPAIASVVTARAVAELPVLVELAAPLLAARGRLIALKGRLDKEELERGDRAGQRCGLSPVSVRNTTLPAGGEARAVVVYAKTGEPAVSLPRRPGMAAKRPLA